MEKIPPEIKTAIPGVLVGAWQAMRSEGNVVRRAASGALCATIVLGAEPWARSQEYAPPWLVLVALGAFAVPALDLGVNTLKEFPLKELLVEFVRERIINKRKP